MSVISDSEFNYEDNGSSKKKADIQKNNSDKDKGSIV